MAYHVLDGLGLVGRQGGGESDVPLLEAAQRRGHNNMLGPEHLAVSGGELDTVG